MYVFNVLYSKFAPERFWSLFSHSHNEESWTMRGECVHASLAKWPYGSNDGSDCSDCSDCSIGRCSAVVSTTYEANTKTSKNQAMYRDKLNAINSVYMQIDYICGRQNLRFYSVQVRSRGERTVWQSALLFGIQFLFVRIEEKCLFIWAFGHLFVIWCGSGGELRRTDSGVRTAVERHRF